tara:strand:- start:474 stop:755 length:282 start_codon:yes stop_codon:yes gene_type:complete
MELLVVLAIIILVVVQPAALAQLNTTVLGKMVLLGGLIASTLYKPYIGLLVLLLIVCLTMNREGFTEHIDEEKEEDDENRTDLSVENEEKLQP